MAMKLPREIDFVGSKPSSLPNGTSSISSVSVPSNGATFTVGDILQIDLPSRGYLVPSSLYMRYRVSTPTVASAAASVVATPVYTYFTKLETLIGSQVVESINNYGQLNNMIVNCKMTPAQKVGIAAAFGYRDTTSDATADYTNSDVNGRLLPDNTTDISSYAGPVNCILSNADKLVPLKFMPAVRLQLTVDSALTNIYQSATDPTSFTISNFELCYDLVDFPAEVDGAVASMADANGKIFIKSQSYISSGQNLASGSVGNLEFIYNFRLASIKSLFLLPSGTASVNRLYDSFDATTQNGSYQFFVASMPYPQRPISTAQHRLAGVAMELSTAFGPAHDLITTQFGSTLRNLQYATNGTTTAKEPAQFYIGTNTERLSSNAIMLSGVSSQNSPISLRLDLGTATAAALTLQLVAMYDAVFEIDIANKQVAILQ
jgi:hypothetical protein